MKKFFKFIWEVILYIWQLPQNLIGLFLRLFYPKAQKMEIADVKVLYDYSFPGGISLGRTIFVGTQDRFTSMHEHGHQIQSMILGPLYLFVIGIPSIEDIIGTPEGVRRQSLFFTRGEDLGFHASQELRHLCECLHHGKL